jgi:hypothetical protein
MLIESDEQLVAEIVRRFRETHSSAHDWVAAFHAGDMLTTDAAGYIAGVSAETIRRRAVEAAMAGRPIGVQHASVWLISRARLLDWIEQHEGLPARLAAETRARQYR